MRTLNPKGGVLRLSVRLLRAVFCLGLFVRASMICPVYAQPTQSSDRQERFSGAFLGAPLEKALTYLIDATRINLIFETDLVSGRTTYCKAEALTVEAALKCLLADTGLDYVRLSSGTYVLIDSPRETPQYGWLAGSVVDVETGEPLAYARVSLDADGRVSATNKDGRFVFRRVMPGKHHVGISHVAYYGKTDTLQVNPNGGTRIEIGLSQRVYLTAPMIIYVTPGSNAENDIGLDREAGDHDAISMGWRLIEPYGKLDRVTGVRFGNALADLHIQGGDSNEHQYYLDGVPVYLPLPGGGIVGPFSPFAINRIFVRKAGFGARYGSHLSGVVEVEQDPMVSRPALTFQLDPLSLNGRWSAGRALGSEKNVNWMLAVRKSLWGIFQPGAIDRLYREWSRPDPFFVRILNDPDTRPVLNDSANAATRNSRLDFTDLHAAVHLRTGSLSSLQFSFYRGNQKTSVGPPGDLPFSADEYSWINRIAHLRYEWVQNRYLFLHAGIWTSTYQLTNAVSLPDSSSRSSDFDEIDEVGIRFGGDLALSGHHVLSGGLEVSRTDSDYSISLDPRGSPSFGPESFYPETWRFAALLEDQVGIGESTRLVAGTRISYLPGKRGLFAEPRLAFSHDLFKKETRSLSLNGAFGLYRQFVNSYDLAAYNLSSAAPRVRFWLPIGREQRLPESYHVSLAISYRPNQQWVTALEGYFKYTPHTLLLNFGRLNQVTEQDFLTDARGNMQGISTRVIRDGIRHTLNATYEFTYARRQVSNRFGGQSMSVPWITPRRAVISLDVSPFTHFVANVRWEGLFGRQWGLRQVYYDYLEPDPESRIFPPFNLSEPGRHRLPAFSQWDVGLAYTLHHTRFSGQFRLTLTNVFNRKNVLYWSLVYDDDSGNYQRVPIHHIPFFPAISIQLSH